MGLDCTLLPVECDAGKWGYSHSMIRVERVYAFYDKLKKLPDAGPVPPSFSTFRSTCPDGKMEGEPCYGDTQTDQYGAPLRCVWAEDVAAIRVPEDAERSVRAAIAYCKELEPKTRIALFWH